MDNVIGDGPGFGIHQVGDHGEIGHQQESQEKPPVELKMSVQDEAEAENGESLES
jgi:hypothetical protein